MARRGWVGAQTEPDRWMRLVVFDDGWVELPGLARSMSAMRGNLQRAVRNLAIFVGALCGAALIVKLTDRIGLPAGWGTAAALALIVGAAGFVLVSGTRQDLKSLRRTQADFQQARADRASGVRIRRTPGAPLLRRADSAQQFADWLDGEVLVRAADIRAVAVSTEGEDHRATVTLTSGEQRTYRSPDAKLGALLGSFSSSPADSR